MQTHGVLAPDTAAAVREAYADLGSAAQTVVKESAKAMDFDRVEYGERVSTDVVATARDALFASLLVVHVGTREEFDDWLDEVDEEYDVQIEGSETVEHVAWHVVLFEETVVAATYQNEADAAVGTLRRIAFGRFYRPAL